MQAKDEELHKVKEKQILAEQQLQEMEEKQQQVQFRSKNAALCPSPTVYSCLKSNRSFTAPLAECREDGAAGAAPGRDRALCRSRGDEGPSGGQKAGAGGDPP